MICWARCLKAAHEGVTAIQPASHFRVLGLFAKEPKPGQVKTRLAAETSVDWAARVATAFLLDTVERLTRIDAHRILAYTPSMAYPYFADLAEDRFHLLPQTDGDLGQR